MKYFDKMSFKSQKKSANLSDFSTLKLTSSELVFKIEIKLKVKGTLIINFQLLIIN